MFRLGDIYLMYAEAVARGGEGSKASAVEYINALRKRAYGDEKHNISENWLEENNFRNLLLGRYPPYRFSTFRSAYFRLLYMGFQRRNQYRSRSEQEI